MTPTELADVMARLLDGEEVEPEDNFFDVGGTSLLAIELIAAIEAAAGVQLPLIDIIRSPTPVEISRLIARSAG